MYHSSSVNTTPQIIVSPPLAKWRSTPCWRVPPSRPRVLLYAQLWYSESKSGASKSKSKRTTRRENFIPILDIVELSAVANAVIEAIQLFRDPSRKEEQKAWLAVGQKRKRGA